MNDAQVNGSIAPHSRYGQGALTACRQASILGMRFVTRSVALIVFSVGMNYSLPLAAQDFWTRTGLLEVTVGSTRSRVASTLKTGGYTLSNGNPVRLSDWYTPRHPDLTFMFLTAVTEDLGIIWGLSTGERAEKYKIRPALHLGFVAKREVFDGAVISMQFVYVLEGDLSENSCLADYGDIGGLQEVNCRLAAGLLPPKETLNFLVDADGADDSRLIIGFSMKF